MRHRIVNPNFQFSIRTQLLIGVLLLVIIPVLSIGVWVDYRVSTNLSQRAQQDIGLDGDNISIALGHFLTMHKENLLVASLTGDWQEPKARKLYLESLLRATNGWSQVNYWDAKTGELLDVVPNGISESASAQGENWFELSKVQTGVVIKEISNSTSSFDNSLLFAMAVRDDKGQLNGIISTILPLKVLTAETGQLLALEPMTRVWLVAKNNQFVLEPKNYPGEPSQYTIGFLHQLEQGNLLSVRTLPDTGWTLIVGQNRQVTLAQVGQLSREIEYITGGILIAALFLAFWYVGALLYPLRKLMDQIHALREGYSVQDLPALPEHRNEIGQTAEAFRALATQMQEMSRDVILAFVVALEARDPYTKYHSERVALYAQRLATQLKVSPIMREHILQAGLLHDIGKIGVPESVLNKPGILSPEELSLMRSHSRQSYDIISEVPAYMKAGIAEAVLQHHERWDGHGYPQELSGEDICLEARILAVADAFDAMTSNRVYRQALSFEEALAELERGSGRQFAPECVAALLNIPAEELRSCQGETVRDQLRIVAGREREAS